MNSYRICALSLWLSLPLAIASCGAEPKQVNDSNDSPVIADPVDDPDPSEDPKPTVSDDVPKPRPDAVVGADDYEIDSRDCQGLATVYGAAWLNDELEKLNKKKLKQAEFDRVAAQLKTDSQGMADQYDGECQKTVGTAYLRDRLQCAMKAKNMQRFNDCMDGKTEKAE